MIRLSVNVLTSATALLKRLNTYQFSSLSELSYSKVASLCVEDIFTFARECGWVGESENKPFLTHRGFDLLKLQEQGLTSDLKRQMLLDYLLKVSPIWSNRIPYGRSEAAIFMTKDERACFAEAGLLSEQLDTNIIDWWDRIASKIRMRSQRSKNNIGRIGEKNTITYERVRTACEPKWMSVDSNLAGYDIKSQQSKDNSTALLIEVKASTFVLSEASFHVTSHEWGVALRSSAYVFHLWSLSNDKKLLAVVSPYEVQPYLPTNNLEGEWESAKIPYSCFQNKFVEII